MSDRRSDHNKVICPACNNEFKAIPVAVQEELETLHQRVSELLQAVGLATTLAGTVEVDVNNPLDMMLKIVESVNAELRKAQETNDE